LFFLFPSKISSTPIEVGLIEKSSSLLKLNYA